MDPLGHDEILSPFSNMKYVETEDGDETGALEGVDVCLLYTSPRPRDATLCRVPACG